jgi:hypothetical protein
MLLKVYRAEVNPVSSGKLCDQKKTGFSMKGSGLFLETKSKLSSRSGYMSKRSSENSGLILKLNHTSEVDKYALNVSIIHIFHPSFKINESKLLIYIFHPQELNFK